MLILFYANSPSVHKTRKQARQRPDSPVQIRSDIVVFVVMAGGTIERERSGAGRREVLARQCAQESRGAGSYIVQQLCSYFPDFPLLEGHAGSGGCI